MSDIAYEDFVGVAEGDCTINCCNRVSIVITAEYRFGMETYSKSMQRITPAPPESSSIVTCKVLSVTSNALYFLMICPYSMH